MRGVDVSTVGGSGSREEQGAGVKEHWRPHLAEGADVDTIWRTNRESANYLQGRDPPGGDVGAVGRRGNCGRGC